MHELKVKQKESLTGALKAKIKVGEKDDKAEVVREKIDKVGAIQHLLPTK